MTGNSESRSFVRSIGGPSVGFFVGSPGQNGRSPITIRQNVTASANWSVPAAAAPRYSSGAAYGGVPRQPPWCVCQPAPAHSPKSATFTLFPMSNRFDGLMSQCCIPCEPDTPGSGGLGEQGEGVVGGDVTPGLGQIRLAQVLDVAVGPLHAEDHVLAPRVHPV